MKTKLWQNCSISSIIKELQAAITDEFFEQYINEDTWSDLLFIFQVWGLPQPNFENETNVDRLSGMVPKLKYIKTEVK